MAEQSLKQMYEAAIRSVPNGYDEAWLGAQLARRRVGDETASRAISERCLRTVFEIAVEECRLLHADDKLLDAVQEGNAALVDAISGFAGASAAEFAAHLRSAVIDRVKRSLDKG